MNNKNNDDKSKRGDNYDRRPITDPPKADEQNAAVSATRTGFYIILLLAVTAIGIYAILSSIMPDPDKNKRIETGSVYSTPTPYAAAVPANADALPQSDEDDALMPTARPTSTPAAASPGSAETASEAQPAVKLCQPPVSGRIIKDYSADDLVYSETMKDWRAHCGVDIGANPDTIVTAIKDGTLKKVYEDSLLGTTVTVHHSDDGTDSVYSNLKDVPDLPIGSEIKMGDTLGKVGSSAVSEQSDEPHLHFEIRKDDKTLDPKEFVAFEEVDYVTPEESDEPAAANSQPTGTENPDGVSAADETAASSTAYTPDPYTDGEDIETMIID